MALHWSNHIYRSINQPLLNCARYCQAAGTMIGSNIDKPLCDFFVQTSEACHLGNYETNRPDNHRSGVTSRTGPRSRIGEINLLLRNGMY